MKIKRAIMNPNLLQQYMDEFQTYAIGVMYGNITIGADIEEEWKDKPVEE